MRTILVADDEPSLRMLVKATIAADAYEVIECLDGAAAWELIRERTPALAILDWQMPGYSGLDLCAIIKRDPRLASTRVILLTSRAQAADIAAGKEAQADVYLTKPFSPIQLLEVVERLLNNG